MIKFKKKKAVLKELIIPESSNILKASKIIDLNGQGLGFVCKNKKLLVGHPGGAVELSAHQILSLVSWV